MPSESTDDDDDVPVDPTGTKRMGEYAPACPPRASHTIADLVIQCTERAPDLLVSAGYTVLSGWRRDLETDLQTVGVSDTCGRGSTREGPGSRCCRRPPPSRALPRDRRFLQSQGRCGHGGRGCRRRGTRVRDYLPVESTADVRGLPVLPVCERFSWMPESLVTRPG